MKRAEFGDLRIEAKTWALMYEDANGCWIWTGKSLPNGSAYYRRRAAWRWVYEKLVRPIGPEMVMNSALCDQPILCVNPDHRLVPDLGVHKCWCGGIHNP